MNCTMVLVGTQVQQEGTRRYHRQFFEFEASSAYPLWTAEKGSQAEAKPQVRAALERIGATRSR